ncbi:uncharacterized protein LOC135376001 [Ornithodoros turicata]|uniref:uncharacterized protein LOC135376001 n=1 Tax=Ornithodoros turicata TaxID=34597 RepID=UPI003139386B
MIEYSRTCVPEILERQRCDETFLLEHFFKDINADCGTSKPVCLECTQNAISDAEDVCLRKYEQEHGIISRGLMSGNDKRLCCMLDYKKNCVPDQLKPKGCGEQLLQNYVVKVQSEMRYQCAGSSSMCTVCPRGLLDSAKSTCYNNYQNNQTASKLHCCVIEYSRTCVPEILARPGCDETFLLDQFFKDINADCGTSKPVCLACNQKAISDAEDVCLRKYEQEHGIISRGLMSGNDKRLCCMLDYKKNCVPGQLKPKGCGEQLLQNYVAKMQSEMRYKCAASNSMCTVCPQGLLDSAKSTCYNNYQNDQTASKRHLENECFNKESPGNEVVITAFRYVIDMVDFGNIGGISPGPLQKMVRWIYTRYKYVCITVPEGPLGLMSEFVSSTNAEFNYISADIVDLLARAIAHIRYALRKQRHLQAVYIVLCH